MSNGNRNRSYIASPRVHAWANGFGVWHVRVDRAVTAPIIVARGALREELQLRESPRIPVDREVWMRCVHMPELDTETTIVYREFIREDDES